MTDQSLSSNELNSELELNEDIPTENWMSSLPTSLHNLPISKLAIPGTHNSGTFSLSTTIAPGAEPWLRKLTSIPLILHLIARRIIDWSKCQNLNIAEQLNAGVRFFDLRVAPKPGSEEFYIVHDVFGPKLSDLLDPLLTFLEAHPKEVVLLYFQHLYDMQTEKHKLLIDHLISKIGSKLCNQCPIRDLTLQNMWSRQKQVVVFYNDNASQGVKQLWPECTILPLWAETDNPDACIAYLNEHFNNCPTRDFTVCQGVLTPYIWTIIKHLGHNGNVKALSETLLQKLCYWVKWSSQECAFPPTIITADYIENGDLIQTILKLNYKQMHLHKECNADQQTHLHKECNADQ